MKSYPEIPGTKKIPWGEDCIAFKKFDGSNLRFEYNKKQGWYKFGTRRRLFDETDKEYGRAIEVFKNQCAEGIEKVLTDKYKGAEAIVFCEFFGPNSFAGWHDWNDQFQLPIIEIGIHKKGFVLPQDFIDNFGHLNIAQPVYFGPITKEFVESVRNNEYNLDEGVVVKGSIKGKNPVHSYWMAKIKTLQWLKKLDWKAQAEPEIFGRTLEENQREQS